MSMRILALTAVLTVGLGSAAMAQDMMIDDDGPEISRQGPIMVPIVPFLGRADLYVDEDNTGAPTRSKTTYMKTRTLSRTETSPA